MAIEVGVVLFGHQANPAALGAYGRIIHDGIVWKRAPYTVALTGSTVDTIASHHPLIAAAIRDNFAHDAGAYNPHQPEIIGSTQNHIPVVPLRLELEVWGAYLGITREQVSGNKDAIKRTFHKNSRGIFPPEAIFAPAAAHDLRACGLEYSIMDGAHLSPWEKGQVFQVAGLKVVPRNNEFDFRRDAWETVDRIIRYASEHRVGRVVIGTDLDIYEKMGWSVDDQIRWMHAFHDACFFKQEVEFKNIASIAEGDEDPLDLKETYRDKGIADPHHFTSSWLDAEGGLDFLNYSPLSAQINDRVNHFVRYYDYLHRRLRNVRFQINWKRPYPELYSWYQNLAHRLHGIGSDAVRVFGMEFRHPGWVEALSSDFHNTMNWAMIELSGIDGNLYKLEECVFH